SRRVRPAVRRHHGNYRKRSGIIDGSSAFTRASVRLTKFFEINSDFHRLSLIKTIEHLSRRLRIPVPLVRTPAVLLHPACIFAGFAWGALSTTHRTHAVDGATQAFIVPLIPCLVGPSTRISARIGKEGFDMNAPGVRRALLLSTAVLLAS